MKMMKSQYNTETLIYLLFVAIWPVILLPKTLQIIPLIVIAFLSWMQWESKVWDGFGKLQIVWLGIYLLSIGINIFSNQYDATRILATVNTYCMNAVGLILYQSFRTADADLKKIGKICVVNTGILLLLNVLYHLAPEIILFGNRLSQGDRLYGVTTLRFLGFMDYSNLVLFFVLFQFPVALYYLQEKHLVFRVLYCVALFFALMDTNSRSALVIYLTVLGCYFLFLWDPLFRYFSAHKVRFILIAAALGILILFICRDWVMLFLEKIWTARKGSNNARTNIYRESLERVMAEGPVLGMAIKEKIEGMRYLYGSHSTYVGVVYRTGIAGGCVYLCSLVIALVNLLRIRMQSRSDLMLIVVTLGIFVLLVLEDVDGVAWTACLFYVNLALIQSIKRQRDAD